MTVVRMVCAVAVAALLLGLPAAAAVPGVVRSMTPSGDGTTEVRLAVEGFAWGGMAETLPPGATFVATGVPAEQYRLTGRNVLFVVAGEPEVRYTVRGCLPGSCPIAGAWEALDLGVNGTVSGEGAGPAAADGSGPVQGTPLPAALSLASAGLAFLAWQRRRP